MATTPPLIVSCSLCAVCPLPVFGREEPSCRLACHSWLHASVHSDSYIHHSVVSISFRVIWRLLCNSEMARKMGLLHINSMQESRVASTRVSRPSKGVVPNFGRGTEFPSSLEQGRNFELNMQRLDFHL